MEAKKCNYCGRAIPSEKRADTKFCSNSCKANHWEQNKGKKSNPEKAVLLQAISPKPSASPLEGLRGVIENKPQTDVKDVKEPSKPIENERIAPAAIRTETQAYKHAFAAKKKMELYYQRARNVLANYQKLILLLSKEKEGLKYVKSKNRFPAWTIDAMAIQDAFEEDTWGHESNRVKQKEVEKKIAELTENKFRIEKMLAVAKQSDDEAAQKLLSTPQYEPVKQNPLNIYDLMKAFGQTKPQPEEHQPKQIEAKQEEEQPCDTRVAILSNSKLMSSRELRELNYKSLNFQGRWHEFFGLPAVVFHLAVHGKPGEGKSTFCIQFADYLAKNFGHVVYISGEEGFSKTQRDKVVNNKIDNLHLFFADISSYDQIKSEIENNKFHFIFIDSLDTLKIDVTRLRDLRKHYPQSGFITISQSTKDGKMRGSQEIIHDADITVTVEDGMAITTKNRYHPRGTEFRVFPISEKPMAKKIEEPRNII